MGTMKRLEDQVAAQLFGSPTLAQDLKDRLDNEIINGSDPGLSGRANVDARFVHSLIRFAGELVGVDVLADQPGEVIARGDGATTDFGVLDLQYHNVDESSVTIVTVDGTGTVLTVTDDGAGNLTGDTGAGGNTVDYNLGQVDLSLSSAPPSTVPIAIEYTVADAITDGDASVRDVQILLDLIGDVLQNHWGETNDRFNVTQ